MVILKVLTSKIVLVKSHGNDLAETFIRFQEHYESPEFRDKIFTLGQFRQWYSEKFGAFTYSRDWAGFNIPSYVLQPFKDGLFDPLTDNEKEMVELFKDRRDKFYIIGAQDEDVKTLDHEICHALYYTDDRYRDQVNKVLSDNEKLLKPVVEYIKGMMYHESVWMDEVHAYMSANYDDLMEDLELDPKCNAIHKKLRAIKADLWKEEVDE